MGKSKKCKFCFSEIPAQATKCAACLEWQTTKKTEHKIYEDQYLDQKTFTNVFGVLKRPFQLNLVNFTRLPYYFTVFIITAIFFTTIQAYWIYINGENQYLLSFLAYSLQMMISWMCVIWIYTVIKRDHNFFIEISRINKKLTNKTYNKGVLEYKKFNEKIFNKKYSIFWGLLVGISSVIADLIIGLPFEDYRAQIAFSFLAFFNMFFGGAALYSMYQFSRYTYKISKKYIRSKFMTIEQKRAVNQIGVIHLRSAILAILPLGLGILAKFFGDWEINNMVIGWYTFFGILIIIYIFWPMENIHNLLKKDRDIQIIAIQMKIRKKLDEVNVNLSSSNLLKISNLRELEKKTSLQKTWPFDTRGIWLVFLATLFPIILMIINEYLVK
ncbi:hypothetical protein [uncultured Dokdonia sp.]|uniref:hypothetical protein n=1 Tax=uncultured Dokdonia sp. TaxID=575653 RepID=UPI00260AF3CA|nr:hypothetical protein [uncultured Dokdonia sp.]